jgi:hypothetical protein
VGLGLLCLTSGDTLDIRGGTYDEQVTVDASKSGTAEQPTVIQGHAGETVILNPSTPGGAGSILWVYGSYITVRHLTIDGANLPSGPSNLVGFGETSGTPSHHLTLEDVEVKNLKGQGSACVTSYGANHTDFTYRRLQVHDCGTQVTTPNPGAHCMYIPGTRYTVENSEIYNCYTEGIQIYSSGPQPEGTVVGFSRVHHTGAEGILVSGDHSATIGRNVVYATGANAEAYGTTAAIKGTVSGETIAHNTIYDCPLGLAVTAGSGLRAQNNIINTCATDVSDEGSGNTLSNNICDVTVGDKCTAGDPRFMNAPGGDFNLGPGSDAIDAGTVLSRRTAAARVSRGRLYDGTTPVRTPRYAGTAPDAGAHEAVEQTDPGPCSGPGE